MKKNNSWCQQWISRTYATIWVSIEQEIKYEGFGGGPSVGGGPGARAPWAPLNPALANKDSYKAFWWKSENAYFIGQFFGPPGKTPGR